MNFYEEINSAKDIFVTDLLEPSQNTLQFTLAIGKTSIVPEDIIVSRKNLGTGHRIYFDNESDMFQVFFDSYICYTVINEGFEILGGEEFTGEKLRIYTQSNFLSYVKADTFASEDYPGAFKHFCFISQNHIINVASVSDPIIKKLQ